MLTIEDREILQAARDLIGDPEHWCTGYFALDENGGQTVHVMDPSAVRLCARGSVIRVLGGVWFGHADFNRIDYLLNAMANRLYAEDNIAVVNNNLGHEATLAVFDKLLADETIA